MSENKSFWSTLPGILTGVAAIITATTGFLIVIDKTDVFKSDKQRPGYTRPKSIPGEQLQELKEMLIGLLKDNERGWNTNDVDLVMSPWHKEAKIFGPDRKLHSWHEYRDGLWPRIQNQSVIYHECSNLRWEGDKALIECVVKSSRRQPEGEWVTHRSPIHFEFIRDGERWYLWRQEL